MKLPENSYRERYRAQTFRGRLRCHSRDACCLTRGRRRKGASISRWIYSGLNHKRRLTTENMLRLFASALDKLPDKYRLPLWLSCETGLSHQDAAEMLLISPEMLLAFKTRGMRMLLRLLEQNGAFTDEASAATLLGAMTPQPAPASLVRRINALVAMPEGVDA